MNPVTIEGTLLWDLYQYEGDPILVNVMPFRSGNESICDLVMPLPVYDLVLQQAFAKILNENQNEPMKVRVTVEVLK